MMKSLPNSESKMWPYRRNMLGLFGTPAAFITVVLIQFSSGCDSGIQGGEFTVSSVGSWANRIGTTVVVEGHQRGDFDSRLLLLTITVVPESGNTHFSSKHGQTASTFDFFADDENALFSLVWDRVNDVVSVANQDFKRSEGSYFVVHLEGRRVEVTQRKENQKEGEEVIAIERG